MTVDRSVSQLLSAAAGEGLGLYTEMVATCLRGYPTATSSAAHSTANVMRERDMLTLRGAPGRTQDDVTDLCPRYALQRSCFTGAQRGLLSMAAMSSCAASIPDARLLLLRATISHISTTHFSWPIDEFLDDDRTSPKQPAGGDRRPAPSGTP